MDIEDLKRLAGITEDLTAPANLRTVQELQLIQQLLIKSVNLFGQNNSLGGKEYVKKAMIHMEAVAHRLKNS